jgi:hypothetical protein
MRHADFPNLTRACRSARWPGRLDRWFPAARRVVRAEAAAPPRGSSEAVEIAEHERSLELLQLERRSGETQTETSASPYRVWAQVYTTSPRLEMPI